MMAQRQQLRRKDHCMTGRAWKRERQRWTTSSTKLPPRKEDTVSPPATREYVKYKYTEEDANKAS